MLQLIRYSETPVGPYDEMVLLPGDFGVPGGKGQNMRITRIYVSQKDTCYNGQSLGKLLRRVIILTICKVGRIGTFQS